MDKYIQEQGYGRLQTLVAFSGEVHDPESGPDPFSEANMNPGSKGQEIRDAFDTDLYQILIVANKYQTGFDQPLLTAMYVDKRLAGVTTVQTLSRLNRIYPGKPDPFVLDFVNKPEEILAAFAPYYRARNGAGGACSRCHRDTAAEEQARHLSIDGPLLPLLVPLCLS
jgi:type I restriction enzyme, R subunit